MKLYPVDPQAVYTSCRSCGARIAWGKTENGKNVPLSIDCPEAKWSAETAPHCVEAPSHFLSCPNASKHSKKGKA